MALLPDLRSWIKSQLNLSDSQVTTIGLVDEQVQTGMVPVVTLTSFGGPDDMDGDLIHKRVHVRVVAERYEESRDLYSSVRDVCMQFPGAGPAQRQEEFDANYQIGPNISKPSTGADFYYVVPFEPALPAR